MLVQCIRFIQRLLGNLARLRLSRISLLALLRPLFALRMPHRNLAWLVPTRFLPSPPQQLDGSPPGKRSSMISLSLSTLPRALFRRRLDTLPMHVENSCSPSSTLNSPASRPGQKSTFDDLGYPYAENSELEKDGIFARSTSSSPLPEATGSVDEGIEPKGHRHLNMSEAVPGLVAVTSYEYERYSRGVITDKHFWQTFMIDPLETDFSRSKPPNQWKHYTHPDGGIYFLNESWQIPVITDVYIDDNDPRQRLEAFVEKIFSYINLYEIVLPAEACLVLEFRRSGRCGYYFVDHSTRCLFWLEDFDAMVFLDQVRVEFTPPLVGHEMKSLYWLHNEYFPELRPFIVDALKELKDVLIHAVGDSLTSPWNMSPYKLDDLQKMLSLVKDIESSDSRGPGSAAVVYRLLHNFYHERLLHLHGEKGARLNIDQSIHPEGKRTFIIKILSPMLLFGPEVHLRKLVEMSVDSLVRRHDWDKLLAELTNEWKEFTLYATVLLNANMAFLAIQSVDNSSSLHHRSAQQRASYFSVVTSIGAIALGLLLVRQHNTALDPSFLAHRSASMLGLETLSVMYSLPYALLMWGMASFLAAFSIMCFGSKDTFTIVMMSMICFTLSILLLWSVTVVYENKPFWHAWPFRQLRSWIQPDGIMAGEGRLRASRSNNV